MRSSWARPLDEHDQVSGRLRAVLDLYFDPAVSMLVSAFEGGKKVLMCGNGGSCADAAHFSAELSVRFKVDRKALPALVLNDPAMLTACANDYGYEAVFARQVEALGQAGDVLVAFSTSGRSSNVVEAVHKAKFLGLKTLGFSGNQGIIAGPDIDLVVPSKETARIQEMHGLMIHMLCEEIDSRLPKGEEERWAPR
jgi:D-sedoheptulose 7-phosphate isomerase